MKIIYLLILFLFTFNAYASCLNLNKEIIVRDEKKILFNFNLSEIKNNSNLNMEIDEQVNKIAPKIADRFYDKNLNKKTKLNVFVNCPSVAFNFNQYITNPMKLEFKSKEHYDDLRRFLDLASFTLFFDIDENKVSHFSNNVFIKEIDEKNKKAIQTITKANQKEIVIEIKEIKIK